MKNSSTVVLVIVIAVVTGMLVTARYFAHRPATTAVPIGDNFQGQPAPEFELTTLEGKKVNLSDYRGKAVLLNFWATWCAPCKIEIPWFMELQKQYASQGLQVLGVSMDDEGKDKVAKFSQQMKIDYPILMGSDQIGTLYGGVEELPTTFFVGRDGKIVKRIIGLVSHSEFEDAIQAALNQGAKQAMSTPMSMPNPVEATFAR